MRRKPTEVRVVAFRTVQQKYEFTVDVPDSGSEHFTLLEPTIEEHMAGVADGDWVDQEVDEQSYNVYGEFS